MTNDYYRMDYAKAVEKLVNAHTGKLQETKWVANNTFLRRNEIGGESVVELIFIGAETQGEKRTPSHPRHRIILWAKNHFRLNFCGHKTVTTYDRFNRFMPQGFKAWGYRDTKRTCNGGDSFLQTPTGTRLFNEPLKLSYDGTVLEPGCLNLFDGQATRAKIHQYAIEYSRKFCKLKISKATCDHCLITHRTEAFFPHLLKHVEDGTMPSSILRIAAARLSFMPLRGLDMTSEFLDMLIEVGWKENKTLRQKPTEEEPMLDYVVQLLRDEIVPSSVKPAYYRKTIRTIVEDFLLDTFGYER